MQAPIEAVSKHIDRFLIERLQAGPALVGLVHLFVVVLLTVILAWLGGVLCRFLSRRFAAAGSPLASRLLALCAQPVRYVTLFVGLSQAVEDAWPAARGPGRWIAGSLFVVAIIVAVRGVLSIVQLVIHEVIAPSVDEADDDAGPSDHAGPGTPRTSSKRAVLPLLQRASQVLLWLSGLILVLDHFGQNVSSVVAALGVTSLAIGLASQQALSNIIAGLVLAIDHPFRTGDRIRLPTGEVGEVLEIGMRSTRLRMADGGLLISPNVDLVAAKLVNLTTERGVRGEVRLSASALLNIEELSHFLETETLNVVGDGLAEPAPKVQLLTVSERVDLALFFWLKRHEDVPPMEERLRRLALKKLQELAARLAPRPPS